MSSRTFSHLPNHHEAPRPSLTADPRIDDVARWWPFRSRLCGHLSHPKDDGCERYDCAVIACGLFEAGCNTTELLEF